MPNPVTPPRRKLPRLGTALLGALLLAGCAGQAPWQPAPATPPGLQAIRAAAAARPNDAATQAMLADAAERGGQPAEAAAALARAMALDGTTPERLVRLGSLYLRAGEIPAAERAFQDARALAPRYAAAAAGLALAAELAGDRARAQDNYRAALALQPGDWTVMGNQALSLLLAGRPREAERVIAAADRDPGAPRAARHNLALVLAAQNQHARAVRVLRQEMGPAEAEALAQEFRAFAEWLAAAPPAEARAALFPAGTLAVAAPPADAPEPAPAAPAR